MWNKNVDHNSILLKGFIENEVYNKQNVGNFLKYSYFKIP